MYYKNAREGPKSGLKNVQTKCEKILHGALVIGGCVCKNFFIVKLPITTKHWAVNSIKKTVKKTWLNDITFRLD
jgi:hypothetical protein